MISSYFFIRYCCEICLSEPPIVEICRNHQQNLIIILFMRDLIVKYLLTIATEYRTMVNCCTNAELALGEISRTKWAGFIKAWPSWAFHENLKIHNFSNFKNGEKLPLEIIHDRLSLLLSVSPDWGFSVSIMLIGSFCSNFLLEEFPGVSRLLEFEIPTLES
jgi:hypothetical protein